jgi:hypothetical protein
VKNQIAQTILSQLGGGKFLAMTGAKSLVASENSLTFRIGRNKSKSNYVQIIYNYGKDLYEMRFGYVSMKGLKEHKRIDEVYCDQLQDLFTEHTGLYTSL